MLAGKTAGIVRRAAIDFASGLTLCLLVFAATALGSDAAWPAEPPRAQAEPMVLAQLVNPADLDAGAAGILAPRLAGTLASPPASVEAASKLAAQARAAGVPESMIARALQPASESPRLALALLVATLFAAITTATLGASRHLRRVYASPRRGAWRRG